jgi:hypothetical protein
MLSDKKLSKIEKILGKDVIVELSSNPQAAHGYVVQAEQAIKQAKDELDANPKYQELKDSLKALSEGMREVKKFQGAKIQYILHLLEERGK